MEKLDKKYLDRLDGIKEAIQKSEILAQYLEDEEEEQFKEMQVVFEKELSTLHEEVSSDNPLQLISLEKALLDPGFEGLFLPRILGYSVLRGEVTAKCKYKGPQNHFKDILLALCNSPNFDILKQRTGQSIQMGFALSSDIWITNLFNLFESKRVKQFLESQMKIEFRDIRNRMLGLKRFKKQFASFNFLTTNFPTTVQELHRDAYSVKQFLVYRSAGHFDNSSFKKELAAFISNTEFLPFKEYLEILMIISMFFELDTKIGNTITARIDDLRKLHPGFENAFFTFHEEIIKDIPQYSQDSDKRFSALINKKPEDRLSEYFDLMDVVHGKGYMTDEAIDAVRNYYYKQKGVSVQNECVRFTIYSYFSRFLNNLEESDYTEYFEINKIFVQYMNSFNNEKFNQQVKALSLTYVKKLLKIFTDKRGKDYQDIKKFVSATFIDQGFMKQKEIVELLKTRRKKKPVS
jgi:hypothetical protein